MAGLIKLSRVKAQCPHCGCQKAKSPDGKITDSMGFKFAIKGRLAFPVKREEIKRGGVLLRFDCPDCQGESYGILGDCLAA